MKIRAAGVCTNILMQEIYKELVRNISALLMYFIEKGLYSANLRITVEHDFVVPWTNKQEIKELEDCFSVPF